MIVVRVWYLSVVQYDKHYLESKKPQRRTQVIPAERGTIRDRFNLPLAVNKIQYNAAICYNDIRQIPPVRWENKQKIWARREYIENLSQFLANSLEMNPKDVEDIIHGKACLFPHTPFVLKENISEELFYKLKIAEKDWLGLQMQTASKRIYPRGKTACDVIGYLGSIGPREYTKIAQEMGELKEYLNQQNEGKPTLLPQGFSSGKEVQDRYEQLQKKAYTINAQVGKSGIECSFEERLRGQSGKKVFEVDIQGNALRTLPGEKAPISGERIILSLSAELQEEAESLLAEYELLQDQRDAAGTKTRRTPWQRGGAIVAMHPKTGEILALASYPRFDPNDLVPAQSLKQRKRMRPSITKWLENESYIGEIWDGKRPLERELFSEGQYYTETLPLTWELYLNTILHEDSAIRKAIDQIDTIEKALNPPTELFATMTFERDQHLLTDLLHMLVDPTCFTPSLLKHVGKQSLSELRHFSQIAACRLSELKEQMQNHFHTHEFCSWREENFARFLKGKRKEERAKGSYARPYSEYLEQQERSMFANYWEKNKTLALHDQIMAGDSDLKELLLPMEKVDRLSYLKALRTFDDLHQPLQGKYPLLRSIKGSHLQKHLAAAFYPYSGFGYGRSQAFRQASPMGSIFKVIPAYAGLMHKFQENTGDLNPLSLTDDMQWTARPGSNSQVLGYFADGTPIKRYYKGGRLPRAYPKIGKIDIVKALERSSNIYFSILASDVLKSPSDLLHSAMSFGLGSKTGIALPDEYQGILPDDILHNKTGLYSFAIGQHSLVVTPLQTATMLSAIANGGEILVPQLVNLSCGKTDDTNFFSSREYPHKQSLDLLGISFPLFAQYAPKNETNKISFHDPIVKDKISMPEPVRAKLLEGMHQVTNGDKGSARPAIMRTPFHNKKALQSFRKIAPEIVGKTGTAEILYKQTIDAETPAQMEKHVWFGGIGFTDSTLAEPELVVVVYSRFGSAGRQGAPIVARLIERWREIQASH